MNKNLSLDAYVLLFKKSFNKLIDAFSKVTHGDKIKVEGKVSVDNFPQSFKIDLAKEFPKEMSIKNLPKVMPVKIENLSSFKLPKNITVKNKNFALLQDIVTRQNVTNSILEEFAKSQPSIPINDKPNRYVNVRLTNGREFINSIATTIGAVGGGVTQYKEGETVNNGGIGVLMLGLDDSNNVVVLNLSPNGSVYFEEKVYTTRVDKVSDTLTYVGKANPGSSTSDAVWQIQKIEISGTVTSVLFADGNTNFDNVWDDRANLNYS